MDQIGPDQHPDIAPEAGQRAGQAAATLATLSEAAARLAAEERRRRLLRKEQREQDTQQRDKLTRELRERADRLAVHAARQRAVHDRRVIAQATDPDWLAHVPLHDLAVAWRTARMREHQFPEARDAAQAVEERLRQMYPHPMDLYDKAVRNGTPRAEAMRMAAAKMAQTPVMRPHPGGHRAGALDPADQAPAGQEVFAADQAPAGDEAFAAAVADEQIRLATGVDAEDYLTELRQLGPGGEAAAQALREALTARAGRETTRGRADAATPDNPTTPGVNEHTTMGMPHNATDMGAANRDTATANTIATRPTGTGATDTRPTTTRPTATGTSTRGGDAPDARTAAQLAGQWYPEGINHSPVVPPHVANKRPATTWPTQTPPRTPGRSR